MRIWVYTIAYNEAPFVKNFLRAYKDAEKIIVYDNFSTDNTVQLLKKNKRVEIRPHDSGNEIRDDMYLDIKNNCWKEARGKADWVIIVDFDEIFTRAVNTGTGKLKFDLDLSDAYDFRFHLIQPCGYNIFLEAMPLYENINPLSYNLKGCYDTYSEKPCCFRPDKIREINFFPGCHEAKPEAFRGHVHILRVPQYKLLHFRYCNLELYFRKLNQYRRRMSDYNLISGLGGHYMWPDEKHNEIYFRGLIESKPLMDIEIPQKS